MKKSVQITKTENSVVVVYDNKQITITDNICDKTYNITQYIVSNVNTSESPKTVNLATC